MYDKISTNNELMLLQRNNHVFKLYYIFNSIIDLNLDEFFKRIIKFQ